MALTPPRFEPPGAYGDRLGDTDFWLPYARAALRRAGLADEPLASGFTGTYPTLVGPTVVVKLFGHFPGWRESYESEFTANRVVAELGGIEAPRVVAAGRLFDGRVDDWPYLIFETLPGQAWREAELNDEQRRGIARILGKQLGRLHSVTRGRPVDLQPDWIATEGAGATGRHRRWGSLPDRLIERVDDYLSDYRPDSFCLVHGDVTEDHVFTSDGEYTGLIDWGDAMITDPLYELAALHFGTFAADRSLLAEYLDSHGIAVDDLFVRRAMQVALMHRFDMFGGVAHIAAEAADLDDLAERSWRP